MNFIELYNVLAESASNTQKVSLLEQYFRNAPAEEVGWAIYLLRGGKLSRIVSTTELRRWAAELAALPLWLVEESYQVVGDLAETVALLVGQRAARGGAPTSTAIPETSSRSLLSTWCTELQALRGADEATRRATLQRWWQMLTIPECLVLHKLITGGLRIGVSRGMVGRALARVVGLDPQVLTHKLMALRAPGSFSLEALAAGASDALADSAAGGAADCTPYPFLLAHPLTTGAESLGAPNGWLAEWKWDGIRAQLVRRAESLAVWSRGEELVSESFPELQDLQTELPDGTVIDGELVVWHSDRVGAFSEIQTRLQRRAVSPKILKSHPVRMIAYDLLEWAGRDLRSAPLKHRRNLLTELLATGRVSPHLVQLSAQLPFESWEQLAAFRGAARVHGAEGVMIKSLTAPYGVGRCRGVWWKWKVDPFSVDGVLLYAQRGHGRRANLYTDFTFGVWDGDRLVPFAKAYSGLTQPELERIDAFVKANRRERFGPVASVEPRLVFEIAFEGIQRSSRHKAGFAVRFPRIVRWRTDKEPHEADTLADLRRFLP